MDRDGRSGQGLGWVGGCAIGCGIATLLLIGVVVAAVLLGRYGMQQIGTEVITELKQQISDANQKEQLPAEAQGVFDESVSLLDRPQTPAMATLIVAQLFQQFMEADDAQRPELLAGVKEVTQFLQTHPDAGTVAFVEFLGGNKRLHELLKDEDRQGFTIHYEKSNKLSDPEEIESVNEPGGKTHEAEGEE